MAKLILNNITSGYQTQDVYNANNDATIAALENTLSRDGSTPNNMNADIDLNSFNLNNVSKLNVTQLVVDGVLVGPLVATGAVTLLGLTDVNSSTPTNRNVLVADGIDWESRLLIESDISDLKAYAVNLIGLSDVNSSTPTNRNVLVSDGVDWESRQLVEADISNLQSYSLTTSVRDNFLLMGG